MENSVPLKPALTIGRAFSPLMKGYVAMFSVLFIWSGFALSIRAISSSALAPADVALFRFAVPLLLLLPLVPGRFASIRRTPLKDLLLVLLGGVPFFFLASLGAKATPAAYVGTILAGTPPFFVAVLSWCIWQVRFSKGRIFALMMILSGVFLMPAEYLGHLPEGFAKGMLFLICGSFTWALYTIGLKRIALDAISVTIVISIFSFVLTLLLIAFGIVPSNLGTFTLEQALPFILIQGFCVGLMATLLYTYAVSNLGSARASTIGSLSPALTAFLAIPVFGESLSVFVVAGVLLAITGVALFNRL